MHTTTAGQSEINRIRAAYAKREQVVPKDRYSLFKEDNLLLHLELLREVVRLFKRFGYTQLEKKKILDVGCGAGFWLRQLVQFGAEPTNLFGVDLLQERIERARKLCPPGASFDWSDATALQFEDSTFDLVLQFTVFTSVLDMNMKAALASEMTRVLKPGGAILWYDYFVSNPSNRDVRGVTRKEIVRLFPGLAIFLKRITLAPPIGRAIGETAPFLYRALSSVKPLCTHYLGFLQKP